MARNVIDFEERLKEQRARTAGPDTANLEEAPVLDMTERRQEIISEERRNVKRTILTEFVGAFALIPEKGLFKVALHDISDHGVAFDVEVQKGCFRVGEEVAMRIYLNQKTYFPFLIKVQNVRTDEAHDLYRHGGNFLKESINVQALSHFVKFLETVSASLVRDDGDIMVTSIV